MSAHAEVGYGAPDKALFYRAMDAVRHERLDVARLTLETLINTYPDSSYTRKAKVVLEDPRISGCRESWSMPSGCASTLDESVWWQ
jgi:hypothetical protein